MNVEFILGRAGSGKTTYCYNQIENELKEDHFTDLYLLVPEQFNLQTQMDLSKRLYPGLLRAQVISFNNLAKQILKETGEMTVPAIDDLERVMILKKIMEDHKKELIFFKKSIYNTGFIENINRFIEVLEQTCTSQKVLQDFIEDARSSTLFKSKLQDIMTIYTHFEAYIAGHFITTEKTMQLLAGSIPKSQQLENTTLWIDGFYGFTNAQLNSVRALIKKCQKVKITLPSDKVYQLGDKIRETHPFYESIKTYQRIMGICQEEQLTYSTHYLSAEEIKNHGISEEIAYIEENYLNAYTPPFTKEIKDLSLYRHTNKNDEIEQTAKMIIELVRDYGYRYHDIAVIVGDLSAYKSSIQSVFKEYEIPCFLDMKRSLHTNSLVAALEGVLEVITSSYAYKSMMALLRTYIFNIDREDIDYLENYILAYGIKGKKKWREVWQFDQKGAFLEERINAIREKVLGPIAALEQRIQDAKRDKALSVADLTKSLYYFLEDTEAYDGLQKHIAYHQKTHNRELELENTQIWEQVVEIFERLVAILGEEQVTVGAYKRIISTSFSYLKMGIIPPSQDQVLIGTIDRTRLPRIKAMFIMGMNEGLIPKIGNTIELFSDMDKVTLNTLCQGSDYEKDSFYDKVINEPMYASSFAVYTALTRATDKLYISAVLADENGKSLRPSLIFYKIKKIFKGAEKQLIPHLLEQVNSPLPTFGYVGGLLRAYMEDREKEEDWKDIVSWYFDKQEWQTRLLELPANLSYTNQQHYLDKETTPLLYDATLKTNISQLETFRSCACCYFIKYGIKAEERKIFSWDSAKIGTLFHASLEQYPKELEKLGTNWTEASENQMEQAVKEATLFAVDHYQIADKDTGKFKYTASKLEKMTKRAIKALTVHLRNGAFIPKDYEVNFAEGEALPPIEIIIDEEKKLLITGQIDRVDIYYKDADRSYIKILDYKTGNKLFSLLEVYYGLQLQLLLYLDAYLKLNKEYEPGGIFYFHITNPYISYQAGMNEEEIDEKNLKQFKLSGLALDELEIISALDKNHTGSTIPVSINKDGSIKKGSAVASGEEFQNLEDHIVHTIRTLGKQILEGKVSAKPFKLGTKHPCLYCAYSTICQFDESQPDNSYETLDTLSKEEVWEKLCLGKETK
ncbi:MAG: UvrD/REP helicase [Clostridia bacterium]|nr:UvrD/REP helicase [Clostridia bacterium]